MQLLSIAILLKGRSVQKVASASLIFISVLLIAGCVSIQKKDKFGDHRLYGTPKELTYNCLVVENVLGEPNQAQIYLFDTDKTSAIAPPNIRSDCLQWEGLVEGKKIHIPYTLCKPDPPGSKGQELTAYLLDFSKMYYLTAGKKHYLFDHPCWGSLQPTLETPTLDLNLYFVDSYTTFSSTFRGIFTLGMGNKDKYPDGSKLYLVPPSAEVLSDSWGPGRYKCICP